MAKQKIHSILFSPRFQVVAFDERGNQIPRLQRSLISLWADHAERSGYCPEGIVISSGSGSFRIFRIEGGWNWEVVT